MTIPVFPTIPGRDWPLTRRPIWKSMRQEAVSGKETVIPQYTFPRYQWSAPINVLRSSGSYTEFQTLLGFINALSQDVRPFYFTDPVDHAVTAQLFGTGDGTTTTFQLVRAFGGFIEPVMSLNSAPVISVAGSPVTPASISNMGVVTFSSAPASGASVTWTGAFYWLCRLDADPLEFSQFMPALHELKKISFTSVKL